MSHSLPCSAIKIPPRDDRQRKEIKTDDLEPSIARFGVLVPIIIDSDNTLIAGERRLTVSLKLGLPEIPVRYVSELSSIERKAIELAENVHRRDLPWQDHCKALLEIYTLMQQETPGITCKECAEALGFIPQVFARHVKVAPYLSEEKIAAIDRFSAAYNLILRREERKTADALADIGGSLSGTFETPPEISLPEAETLAEEVSLDDPDIFSSPLPTKPIQDIPLTKVEPILSQPSASILHADFISWAETYSGPQFNFLHCDFPYGVNLFSGKLSGRQSHFTYDDDSKTYWNLLEALKSNWTRLISPSAHIIFWFSMDFYSETMKFFEENFPWLTMAKRPLVWLKTDNAGIIPDPRRGPRNIIETALFGASEDRFIVKPVANGHGSPTDRKLHPSAKPEPVLKHFFQMFVDENTRLLDPTCGSGSALRAAEALGAKYVLGIEQNEEIAKSANQAMQDFRNLRRVK